MSPHASRPGAAAAAVAVGLLVAGALPPLSPGVQATHQDPDPDDWQVFTRVDATVVDNYAVVNVTAEITEGGPDPQFPFAVRVPSDAYVTGLTITRGNRTYEATVQPKEAARTTYEAHRAQHGIAGLVEARGRSTYRYLVNVEENASVTATLTYEAYLEAENGTYTLPLEAPVPGFGTDRGAAFDVTVRHHDGVTQAWGTPAADATERNGTWHLHRRVGPRPGEEATELGVHYTLPATDGTGTLLTAVENGTGYFAHRFEAPADARTIPVDVALALDTSGSMSGLKIDQLRDAARGIAAHLDGDDRLRLVPFASSARSPWSGYRPVDAANRSAAVQAVDGLVATGSTNVEDAIRTAFAASENASRDGSRDALGVVVFLTDGHPTTGLQDTAALRALARRANDGGARVFGIAFGDDADWGLVHGLARDGGGAALRVPEGRGAEVDIGRFLGTLTGPVLRNVTVSYEGDVTAYHPSAPVLFAGSELLVVGTYDPARGNLSGRVEARGPDGPVNRSFRAPTTDNGPSVLPDLVAYHRIRTLEDRIDAVGRRPDLVQRLLNLSLEHGVVTDVTSLVVTVPHSNETRGLCQGCEPRDDPEAQMARAPSGTGSPDPNNRHQAGTGTTGGSQGSGGAGGGAGSGGSANQGPAGGSGGSSGRNQGGPGAGGGSGGTGGGGAGTDSDAHRSGSDGDWERYPDQPDDGGAPDGQGSPDGVGGSRDQAADRPAAGGKSVPGPGIVAAAAAAALAARAVGRDD